MRVCICIYCEWQFQRLCVCMHVSVSTCEKEKLEDPPYSWQGWVVLPWNKTVWYSRVFLQKPRYIHKEYKELRRGSEMTQSWEFPLRLRWSCFSTRGVKRWLCQVRNILMKINKSKLYLSEIYPKSEMQLSDVFVRVLVCVSLSDASLSFILPSRPKADFPRSPDFLLLLTADRSSERCCCLATGVLLPCLPLD